MLDGKELELGARIVSRRFKAIAGQLDKREGQHTGACRADVQSLPGARSRQCGLMELSEEEPSLWPRVKLPVQRLC